MTAFERLFASRKGLVLIYLAFLGAYLGASGARLRRHSEYNHFVYLADGWLKGRLALDGNPPNENDWAKVDKLTLRDGRVVKGIFGKTGAVDRFYPLSGRSETIVDEDIVSRTSIRYVSFPPFPAVLMLPFVAIWHLQFNDVLFTVLWAALNPLLLFLLLRDLRRRGYSKRSTGDDLWLVTMFGVGSVYYFCSVLGQVWFTAHVIGVTLAIGYAWASLEASRPVLAGLCVGLGFATRTPMGFMFPFFLLEAVRASGGWAALRQNKAIPRELVIRLLRFAAPAAAVLVVLLLNNYARFERFTEFGHKYLNVTWQDRILRWGLFNYHFLSRNLACALVLGPKILTQYPFVRVSQHGMSMLLTSPNLAYTVAPAEKSPLTRGLWVTALAAAIPSLLYQNSGYIQFGYRFSLDYLVFLVMLLAVGGRPFTRLFKAFVIIAIAINLFGAITFDRLNQFSYDDSFFPHGFN